MQRIHGSLETVSKIIIFVIWWFGDVSKLPLIQFRDLSPNYHFDIHGSLETSPNHHITKIIILETISKLPWIRCMAVWRGLPITMDLLHGSLEKISKPPWIRCMTVWSRSPNHHGSVAWQFGEELQSTMDPLHGSLEMQIIY